MTTSTAAKVQTFVTWLLNQSQPVSYLSATTRGTQASFISEAEGISLIEVLAKEGHLVLGQDLMQRTHITTERTLGTLTDTAYQSLAAQAFGEGPTPESALSQTGPGAPKGNINAVKHGMFSNRLKRVIDTGQPQVPKNLSPLKRQLDMLAASIDDIADNAYVNMDLLRGTIATYARCLLAAGAIANMNPIDIPPDMTGAAWMQDPNDSTKYYRHEFPIPSGYIWKQNEEFGKVLAIHPDDNDEYPQDPGV
ncbi:MAG: hypothetical protein V3S68_04815 [Dehalococcoidia bacterium]